MMRTKLCFIIPEYNLTASTHFSYLYDLVKIVSQDMDIFLIAEKGNNTSNLIASDKFYIQKFRFLPLRLAENLLILFWARINGYRNFYIHYSFLSAFNASLIGKISGSRTWYWNCGLPWLYQRGYWRDKFERLVYKLITFLVTGTEGLKRDYARHYKLPFSKIKVLPNWVDIDRFRQKFIATWDLKSKLNISHQKKVILFAHHLSRRKGAHYLPEIVKLLKEESVVLLIIGDGPEKENIESEIQKTGLEKKVRFLNSIPNKEIQDYFKIADIFILPSEEEGFPHVLLEAMATGVPFIAFGVGSVKEISPPEFLEYIITSYDIKSFSNKIKEILHYNGERIEKLSEIEQTWVKQFDLSIAFDKFKDIILD